MKTLKQLQRSVKTSLVSLFLMLSTTAQAGLIFDISSTDIKVGDDFTIDVVFDNPSLATLEGFAFDLNDETLQTVHYTGDSLFNSNFLPFAFGADIDTFVASVAPINSSQVTLATLNFTAHSVGTDTLTFIGDDGFFTGIFLANLGYETVDSSFSFSVTDVSEPTTIAILLSGLAFVMVRRRTTNK